MVYVVLIGKSKNSFGVAARMFSFESKAGKDANQRIQKLRNKVVEQWSLLESYVVPVDQEMVFRLSTFWDSETGPLTWIGCYESAEFANNNRGGTYIGCGLLSVGRLVLAEEAIYYLTNLLRTLAREMSEGARIQRSIFDVEEDAQWVRPTSDILGGERQLSDRYKDGSRRPTFVDFSPILDKGRFDHFLCKLVEFGQTIKGRDRLGDLVIGNSARLARSAVKSQAFSEAPAELLMDLESKLDLADGGKITADLHAEDKDIDLPAPKKDDLGEVRQEAFQDANPNRQSAPKDKTPKDLPGSILLGSPDRKTANLNSSKKVATGDVSKAHEGWRAQLTRIGFLLALIFGNDLLILQVISQRALYRSPESVSKSLDTKTIAEPNGPAMTLMTACRQTPEPLSDLTPADVRQIREEKACLEHDIGEKQTRLSVLNSWLKDGGSQ